MGLQFRGQLLTPGAAFNSDTLPSPAIALECAGSVRTSEVRSRYSFRHLWVLWRFDFTSSEWIEVIRATSDSSDWTETFAPVARRLLDERDARAPPRPPVAQRLIESLRAQLADMVSEDACACLADLERFIAGEIVARTRDLQPVRMPMGRESGWPRLGAHEGSESGQLQAVRRMGG